MVFGLTIIESRRRPQSSFNGLALFPVGMVQAICGINERQDHRRHDREDTLHFVFEIEFIKPDGIFDVIFPGGGDDGGEKNRQLDAADEALTTQTQF